MADGRRMGDGRQNKGRPADGGWMEGRWGAKERWTGGEGQTWLGQGGQVADWGDGALIMRTRRGLGYTGGRADKKVRHGV